DVELTGCEKLQTVDLRPARFELDVETMFLVNAFGDRLIKPAVFSLREPVGREAELVLCAGGQGETERNEYERETREQTNHRETPGTGEGGERRDPELCVTFASRFGAPDRIHSDVRKRRVSAPRRAHNASHDARCRKLLPRAVDARRTF